MKRYTQPREVQTEFGVSESEGMNEPTPTSSSGAFS